jgi:hypothetical protein
LARSGHFISKAVRGRAIIVGGLDQDSQIMKLRTQIRPSLAILAITALVIFAPTVAEAIAMLGLVVVCVAVATRHGIKRSLILFRKEMW